MEQKPNEINIRLSENDFIILSKDVKGFIFLRESYLRTMIYKIPIEARPPMEFVAT
jgi:hypothetical protein